MTCPGEVASSESGVLFSVIQEPPSTVGRGALAETDHIVVLAIPLLTAKHRETSKLDYVVVVDCPTDIALERLLTQRGMDRADAEARIRAQITPEERVKEADYVLDNSGDRAKLEVEVERLWEWLNERTP